MALIDAKLLAKIAKKLVAEEWRVVPRKGHNAFWAYPPGGSTRIMIGENRDPNDTKRIYDRLRQHGVEMSTPRVKTPRLSAQDALKERHDEMLRDLLPKGQAPIEIAKTWTCSEHAMERAAQRDIALDEIFVTLADPERVLSSETDNRNLILVRYRCRLAVNPVERRIVTVMDQGDRSDREEGTNGQAATGAIAGGPGSGRTGETAARPEETTVADASAHRRDAALHSRSRDGSGARGDLATGRTSDRGSDGAGGTQMLSTAVRTIEPVECEVARIRGLTLSVEDVTPTMAQQFLDGMMVDQRATKNRKVFNFGTDMEEIWALTGEPLIFDWAGLMVDGMHRCKASVLSGETFTVLIVRGIDPGVVDRIDTGTSRSYGDVCKMRGLSDPTIAAALIRAGYLWTRTPQVKMVSGAHSPSHVVLDRWLDEGNFEDVAESVAVGIKVRRKLGTAMTPSAAAIAHWLLARVDRPDADRFMTSLADGAMMPATDPIMVLRDRLQRSIKFDEARLPQAEQLALTIKAWNHWRKRAKITRLIATRGGPLTEDNFPVPT
jgi:hypothetical protein